MKRLILALLIILMAAGTPAMATEEPVFAQVLKDGSFEVRDYVPTVVAEVTVPKALFKDLMGVETKDLFYYRQVSQTGAFLAGSANNGAHAANGLAALFIATGQDVANVAESHAAIAYSQLLENGDYYWSITLPALIVATYGGGTGLATQRECLEVLGCYGKDRAKKLAEICAAMVLAGETSLSSAVLVGDWVSSHESLGRNRP